MRDKFTDMDSLRVEYSELSPKYESLGVNLRDALRGFLSVAGIDVLDVQYRVKELESLCEKIPRKGYTRPFEEMEDICGLRIICSYPSDLGKISELIDSEFDVLESTDKADLLEPDRFGYRSRHFIVRVKKEWLGAPNYRGLRGLKAEIQVRTILMHAWADVEHKLAYKKEAHVPRQLRRKLSQLSALFEVADQQLDSLREEREAYRESILANGKERRVIVFDASQGLNIDNLQAVLDLHFPDRQRCGSISELLDSLQTNSITIEDVEDAIRGLKGLLGELGTEVDALIRDEGLSVDSFSKWSQVHIVWYILSLTNDRYWKYHAPSVTERVAEHIKKWRARVPRKPLLSITTIYDPPVAANIDPPGG